MSRDFKVTFYMGRSPGLVVMGGDSCFEGRGFESLHRILDGHFVLITLIQIGRHRLKTNKITVIKFKAEPSLSGVSLLFF